ncbi:MAG: hypothetical protein K2Q24_15350 [Chitinophagaceae bacterium]|nr:hypothetical protein [Chitinophagaceae bacterium]
MLLNISPLKNHIAVFIAMIILTGSLKAQQETYDIVTYTPPAGYVKEEKESCIIYKFTNKKDKSWCQIAIYKNTKSEGSIEKDFDIEWKEIIADPLKVKEKPQKEAVTEADGWKIMSGSAKWTYKNTPVATILTTCSGHDARISFLVNATASRYLDDFDKLIASIDLLKPGKEPSNTTTNNNTNSDPTTTTTNTTAAIEGTWIKSGSVNPTYGDPVSWGSGGYTKDQYVFYTNGTYEFYSKSFGYSVTHLILAKETGTVSINGNQLLLTPKTSVVESWSKRNNADSWGSLVSSEKRKLETVTYTFTKHYFSGIQQWNLVLQASRPTERDGSFSTLTLFPNAYYYAPASNNNTAIDLPR